MQLCDMAGEAAGESGEGRAQILIMELFGKTIFNVWKMNGNMTGMDKCLMTCLYSSIFR